MITRFHVTGGYTDVDPQSIAVGDEDVCTKIEAAKRHDQTIGLPDDDWRQLIRSLSGARANEDAQLLRTLSPASAAAAAHCQPR